MNNSQALPHELVLSIQQILDFHPNHDSDPLDDLSDDFDPVEIINGYFPDGMFIRVTAGTFAETRIEASLAQLESVQNRLAQNARDVQAEIDLLQDELSKEQDSNRMQIIQEMISVR